MRLAVAASVVGLCLSGCAPVSMSPMVMRLGAPTAGALGGAAGLRSGPRVSTPLAAEARPGVDFQGDANVFSLPQWAVSYDVAVSYALDDAWELHGGAQGELAFPLPIPGYGLYAGVSRRFALGALSITPAVAVRGASDFGFTNAFGGPGAVAGVEASTVFALRADPKLVVAFVPFGQAQQVWSAGLTSYGVYAGAVLATRIDYGLEGLEVSAGYGRVFLSDGPDWNAPIFGIRLTR